MGWLQSAVLTFRDAPIEERWTEAHNKRYMPLDSFSMKWYMAFIALGALTRYEGASQAVITRICCGVLLEHAALLVLMSARPDVYRRWRFPILCLHKVSLMAMGVTALTLSKAPPSPNWLQFLGHDLLLMNKLVLMFMSGCSFNLKVTQHVTAQSLMVSMALQHNASLCRASLASFTDNASKYRQVESFLDNIMGLAIPALRQEGAHKNEPLPGDCDACRQCRRVQAFFQVLFGFIVPCMYVLAAELHSRETFLAAHFPGHTIVKRRTAWQQLANFLLYSTQILIGLVFLWQVVGFVTGSGIFTSYNY